MGSRTSSTSRRAALRRRARQRRLAAVLSNFIGLVQAVQCHSEGFGKFVDVFLTGGVPCDASLGTDLVPIPPATSREIVESSLLETTWGRSRPW